MSKSVFTPTTSYLARLRAILILIALFFFVGMLSVSISSQGFLKGLQKIYNANEILNESSMSLQSLESSEQNLSKLIENSDYRDVKYAFTASQNLTREHLQRSVFSAKNFPAIEKELVIAQEDLREFDLLANDMFSRFRLIHNRKSKEEFENLKKDLLVAIQYLNDVKEALRSVQIKLKIQSDKEFSSIYQNRFFPLIVGSILSLVFIIFVMVVGLSSAKRLGLYLSNLLKATDAVSKGDLDYQADILERDEFGRITHEFNQMVQSLKEKEERIKQTVDRVSRLQSITASFSEALSSEQVTDVIFRQAFEALGSDNGAIGILDHKTMELNLKRMKGFGDDIHAWNTFSLNEPTPMSDAVRTQQVIVLRSYKEIVEHYPQFQTTNVLETTNALTSLPLMVGSELIGGISFGFKNEREFLPEDIEFLLALARQCSQALHRAQLYEDARSAILIRDEFLSIASHELRTPLTPLKLQLQNMSRQAKRGLLKEMSDDQLLKMINSSERQVGRIASLVEDLLDVSRISAGKLTLNREQFNLAEMVEEVINNYSQQLQEINSHILKKLDPSISGSYDRVRIEQVFINLLTNAAKYAPGRPIHVTLYREGNDAHLCVRDEGHGIKAQDQARIFDRFERVKDKDNVGGLGLGLYISRQIVEAHQGTIRVESPNNQGATFIVILPIDTSHT